MNPLAYLEINPLLGILDITPETAFELFYESETCRRLHKPETKLYLFGDLFIVDEVVRELQNKQNQIRLADR